MSTSTQLPKIVIVEDQPEIRLLIRLTLGEDKYEMFEACDAQTGLHFIEQVNPDLILLDVMMPGEYNGIVLCDILKSSERFAATPIIFLTGADSEEDKKAGLQAGANYYLSKPFLPERLIFLCELNLEKSNLGKQRTNYRSSKP